MQDFKTFYYKKLEEQKLEEGWIFSEKPTVVNWDKFVNGTNKVIFITGLSGSGKSTFSEKFRLALFQKGGIFAELVFGDTVFSELMKKTADKLESLRHIEKEFIKYSTLDTPHIVEGVHLFLIPSINPKFMDFLKDQTLIFINTSWLKSVKQLLQREGATYRMFKLAGDCNVRWEKQIQQLKQQLDSLKHEDFNTVFDKFVKDQQSLKNKNSNHETQSKKNQAKKLVSRQATTVKL